MRTEAVEQIVRDIIADAMALQALYEQSQSKIERDELDKRAKHIVPRWVKALAAVQGAPEEREPKVLSCGHTDDEWIKVGADLTSAREAIRLAIALWPFKGTQPTELITHPAVQAAREEKR